MDSVNWTYRKFYTALKHFAAQKGYGFQTALSQSSGVSVAFINQILKNEAKKASFELQVKIAEALGFDYESFLKLGERIVKEKSKANEIQTNYKSILNAFDSDATSSDSAFCFYIPFFESDSLSDPPSSKIIISESKLKGREGHEFQAIRVIDNSMWPKFPEGSVLVIDKDDKSFIEGKLYAIKNLAEQKLMIRRPRKNKWKNKSMDSEYFALMCDNPDYLPNLAEVKWKELVIGKVILMLRNLEDE